MSDLGEDLKRDEGFRGLQYDDTEGQPTIGYGTLLPLTKEEGTMLLEHRLNTLVVELYTESAYAKLPYSVQRAMGNMAYNMGVPRLKGFKRMWAALYAGDYVTAGWEAWDSKWRRQVGKGRASRIVARIIGGAGSEAVVNVPELILEWEDRERGRSMSEVVGRKEDSPYFHSAKKR